MSLSISSTRRVCRYAVRVASAAPPRAPLSQPPIYCRRAHVLNGHKVSSGDAGFFSSLYAGDSTMGEIGHPAAGEGVGFTTALLAEIIGTCLLVYTVIACVETQPVHIASMA